jgi:hypothetical protein
MKNYTFCFLMLLAFAAQAQTLTINAHTAEVTGTAKTNLYDLQDLYFIYNFSSGGFEAREVDTRNIVYAANISTVTITGASTAAAKITYLERSHLKNNTTIYNVLVPKTGIAIRYKSSDKKTEVLSRFNMSRSPLWQGHIDSVKTAATDTTTALRLTALRRIARSGRSEMINLTNAAPTIAAGAAAGASPTVAISGNGQEGEITVTSGTSTTTTGVIATITLPVTFPNGARVQITPSNDNAGAGIARVFVTATTSTFVLNASGTALTASTAYKYFYRVGGL